MKWTIRPFFEVKLPYYKPFQFRCLKEKWNAKSESIKSTHFYKITAPFQEEDLFEDNGIFSSLTVEHVGFLSWT